MKHHIEKVPISVRQFIKFCMVGVMNTIVDLGTYILFTRVFGVYYLIANIIAFVISTTNSYILNRNFTFKSKQNKKLEYSAFLLVQLSGLFFTELLLYIFVDLLVINDIHAKLIAIAIVLFWNFFGSKYLVFKVNKPFLQRFFHRK